MRRKAALCVLVVSLAASPGKCQEGPLQRQEPPLQTPTRAPVVGVVDLNDYIRTKARLESLEAEIKRCEERLKRKHFLVAIFGRLFGKR